MVKHLETRTLWVQDQVERGRLKFKKIDGSTNTADVLTNYLSAQALASLLRRLPVTFELGRSSIAAQLQGAHPLDSGGRGRCVGISGSETIACSELLARAMYGTAQSPW